VSKRKNIEALIKLGKTNRQIVNALGVDIKYVYNVRSNLKRQMPKKYIKTLEKHATKLDGDLKTVNHATKQSFWTRLLNLFRG
jgi:FixJ family two-component response regulator